MLNFIFRSKLYRCEALIDDTDYPLYVFIIFCDEELKAGFGNDLTLKTDFENLLPRRDDSSESFELRQTIFAALKSSALFQQAKEEWLSKQRTFH